jgi:hypothetical protein
MGETGGDAPKKKLRLTGKKISATEKQTSSSLQKPLTVSDSAVQVPLGTLNRKGLYVTFIFCTLLIFLLFLHISFLLYPFWFSQVSKKMFKNFHQQTLLASAIPMT